MGANDRDLFPELQRSRRTIVVLDLAESVRLMQHDEAGTIARWRRYVDAARGEVLPRHGGRLVKSLGDGLLVEFHDSPPAVAAALELHALMARDNAAWPASAPMQLRIGVNTAEVLVDELDVYGSGVNLAARLAAMAGVGETVVSAAVRDAITDGLGCRVVDLGECFLKHYEGTVRAFRVTPADIGIGGATPANGPAGERAGGSAGASTTGPAAGRAADPAAGMADECPAVAVVPFVPYPPDDRYATIGDAIADDVIAALSQSPGLRVISRLSTSAFRHARTPLHEIRSLLGVAYVVTGSYRVRGADVQVRAELCDARDGRVVWEDHVGVDLGGLFSGDDVAVLGIARQVAREVRRTEVRRARLLPISNLDGYTLFVAGTFMLHRLARTDFDRAGALLEHLAQRYPRSPAPLAMLAKWHVFLMAQGWTSDALRTGRQAQQWARRALELDSDEALALSMDGMMRAQLDGDLGGARVCCEAAIRSDPQDPHGWLCLAGVHSYLGNAALAESLPLRAIELSPMDPARFLFELFLSAGKLTAGKYAEAAEAARASIRLNAMHPAAHRLLATALSLDGQPGEARAAAAALMRIDPTFRVSEYARRFGHRDQGDAAAILQALRDAGLPE